MFCIYIMEKEYLEKKIKDDLINKDFKDWCKDSVDFLVSVYQFEKCNSFFTINLLLLKDYISWLKKNNVEQNDNIYTLDTLNKLYTTIKKNIKNNIFENYEEMLNDNAPSECTEENENKNLNDDFPFCKFEFNKCSESDKDININNDSCCGALKSIFSFFDINNCFNTTLIIIILIYAVIKYISSYVFFEKEYEQKKKTFELKIPVPENIASHPLLKTLLGGLLEGSNPLAAFQSMNCPFQI